jgi:hypothetical protein
MLFLKNYPEEYSHFVFSGELNVTTPDLSQGLEMLYFFLLSFCCEYDIYSSFDFKAVIWNIFHRF